MVRVLTKTPVHILDKEGRTALLSVGEHDVESYVAAAMEKMGRAVILSENAYLIEQGIANDDIGSSGEPEQQTKDGEPEPGSIDAYIKENGIERQPGVKFDDESYEIAKFHEMNANSESQAFAANQDGQPVAEQNAEAKEVAAEVKTEAPAKKAKQTKGA